MCISAVRTVLNQSSRYLSPDAQKLAISSAPEIMTCKKESRAKRSLLDTQITKLWASVKATFVDFELLGCAEGDKRPVEDSKDHLDTTAYQVVKDVPLVACTFFSVAVQTKPAAQQNPTA